MSVTKGLIFGALIALSNGNYIDNAKLGCQGNTYWNFGLSTKNSIALKNAQNNDDTCRQACNNDNNCDAWGINVNSDDVCHLFTFVDSGLLYNCQANAATLYYGEIKECLGNKELKMSVIAGIDNKFTGTKLVYNTESKCYEKKYPTQGMSSVFYLYYTRTLLL